MNYNRNSPLSKTILNLGIIACLVITAGSESGSVFWFYLAITFITYLLLRYTWGKVICNLGSILNGKTKNPGRYPTLE